MVSGFFLFGFNSRLAPCSLAVAFGLCFHSRLGGRKYFPALLLQPHYDLYFVHSNITVKLYDCEDYFIYSLVKTFLWSALSSFGFSLQWRRRCTGLSPGKVVWQCVMMSDGELRGEIFLLSSDTGEGSVWLQQFLEMHSKRTRSNGTRLKEGKLCSHTGKMKGLNQLLS